MNILTVKIISSLKLENVIAWQIKRGDFMKHKFYCRLRRYYMSKQYEIWSVEFDYGEGYLAEDKLVIKWVENSPLVMCIIKEADRVESEEYLSIILGLFEDITDGEGTFELKRILDLDVEEYDIEDLLKKHSLIFENN